MIYLLAILAIELIFCGVEYIHAKAVFVNPTFLAFIVITASTVFGTIGNSYWSVDISPLTILVIIMGFLAMWLADVLAKKTTHRFKYNISINHEISEISVKKTRENIVLVIVVICTLLYCIDIIRAGSMLGNSGLRAIYAVKRDNSGTSVLIRQGVKFVMAAMFVHTFIFANNVMVLRKKGVQQFKHLIPAICAIICCVFTSVRTEIFRVITALMVCYCILIFQRRNWKMSSLKSFVKKVVPYVFIGVILLVGVRFIVKGTENATSNTYGVFMYITYYIGTPIVVLGTKLAEGIVNFRGNYFGEITLNQLYGFLQDLGFFKDATFQDGSRNVWIDQSNRITANVDTIFGPPTIDFGIIGMVIYIFVLYYFLNRYYYKYIYRSQSSSKRNTRLITYSFLAAISSMAFYTNYFNRYLTVYFILTLIIMKAIEAYYGLSPLSFRSRKRKYNMN